MISSLKPWQEPRPKPGEYVVDIQWGGEAVSVPSKTLRAANRLAQSMLALVGMGPCDVRSVSIYRGKESSDGN